MFLLTCPTCQTRVTFDCIEDAVDRPFCCERCRMIDLGKWLGGEYRISEPLTPDGSDPPASSGV